jgi:xanthine dehydrogenase iron-sulfur cluster and FAD-binding subunit A
MLVLLAAVIALVLVAVVLVRADRGNRSAPLDDVYAAWLNANRRCGEALRAWREAAPAARADAYRAYQAELEQEAAAAAELETHATPLAA